jgi:hydroxyacylglutathione hydrolase
LAIEVFQFPCLKDNFGALVRDSATGAVASIDAPDGAAVLAAASQKGWPLTHVLMTHHHWDHTQGLPEIEVAYPGLKVIGPAKEADRIAGLTQTVSEGDEVRLGQSVVRIIETPGHTAGHIVYHFADDATAFCGDTLFAMGCGRVLETPMAVMWHSLAKLAGLPAATSLYCGHEYTLANAKFALTVDPDNADLRRRAEKVAALRAAGTATLPTTMAEELATNPFLRVERPDIQAHLGLSGADPAVVFAEMRTRKDKF